MPKVELVNGDMHGTLTRSAFLQPRILYVLIVYKHIQYLLAIKSMNNLLVEYCSDPPVPVHVLKNPEDAKLQRTRLLIF